MIIVSQVGDRIAGLLVDAVSDIISFRVDMIQATPDVASHVAQTFIKGVVAQDNRMISIISVDSILPQTEREAA